MLRTPKQYTSFLLVTIFSLFFLGCEGEDLFDQLTSTDTTDYSGYIVISTTDTTPPPSASGKGLVTLFDPNGNFVRLLSNPFPNPEYVSGLFMFDATSVVLGYEGTDRLNIVDLVTGDESTFSSSAFISGAPVRHLTKDANDAIYIVEGGATNTVEKFNSAGVRQGAPFIATGGACTISGAFGITYIPSTNDIGVVSTTNTRFLTFDADTGTCLTSVTTAPFNAQTPTALAYHAATDKLLLTRVGDESIYAVTVAGANIGLAYLNSSIVTDPYAITVDGDGNVYVGSSGTDTVEKFTFNGSTLTRVGTSAFIGPSIYSQKPTSIVVVP